MIVFDPYFVMYPNLVALAGGPTVLVETYPDFGIPLEKVAAAITPRTKAIIVNSPGNPTGVVVPAGRPGGPGPSSAGTRDVLLISDEVYRAFCYDGPFRSPAEWNEDVLVVDGFSKTYGMTGWRLGFRARAVSADPGDGQAPAVLLRLRPEPPASRRRRRDPTST